MSKKLLFLFLTEIDEKTQGKGLTSIFLPRDKRGVLFILSIDSTKFTEILTNVPL